MCTQSRHRACTEYKWHPQFRLCYVTTKLAVLLAHSWQPRVSSVHKANTGLLHTYMTAGVPHCVKALYRLYVRTQNRHRACTYLDKCKCYALFKSYVAAMHLYTKLTGLAGGAKVSVVFCVTLSWQRCRYK